MSKKDIVFLTGTRADFGKLKSLMIKVRDDEGFNIHIFVTGMHLIEKYGYTVNEIYKSGFDEIFKFENFTNEHTMDKTLSKTIHGFSDYINAINPDMIVVHGDRLEALAGAIVGALNNILVAHIEGGEVSGTIDESLRHAISKLSHIHFVANECAKKRLIQLGEVSENIFIIGSPDMDIMRSNNLPDLKDTLKHYQIDFIEYSIVLFHPVTTSLENLYNECKSMCDALKKSKDNLIIIYPNNDMGSDIILDLYNKEFSNLQNIVMVPSIRFEYFLTLMKNAKYMIGNSSAGVREAPFYGLPSINLGTRQNGRANADTIINSTFKTDEIQDAIRDASGKKRVFSSDFGAGGSDDYFMKCLKSKEIWKTSKQKLFRDL